MNVQIHDNVLALRVVDMPEILDMQSAVQLARDLIDAVTQCGHEVKLNVEVPRHQPTDMQLATAITRVAHIRRASQDKPWNDTPVNADIVNRVLEACL